MPKACLWDALGVQSLALAVLGQAHRVQPNSSHLIKGSLGQKLMKGSLHR